MSDGKTIVRSNTKDPCQTKERLHVSKDWILGLLMELKRLAHFRRVRILGAT
jgi:hypothetical protein